MTITETGRKASALPGPAKFARARNFTAAVVFAIPVGLLATAAHSAPLSEREQGFYLSAVAIVHGVLGLHITHDLPWAEQFVLFVPGLIEGVVPTLSPITDQTMQRLLMLKEKLAESNQPLLGQSSFAAGGPGITIGGKPLTDFSGLGGLDGNWARTALSSGQDAVGLALRAIGAYEQAYDQPTNRRLRLQARALNCAFLQKLHDVVFEDPQFLISQGMLSKPRFEARIVEPKREFLEQLAQARQWVCRPIPDPTTPMPKASRRTGTAFIIHPDGRLLTAFHVVKDAKNVNVTCPGIGRTPAALDRSSELTGLAILRIAAHRPTAYLTFADPRTLKTGDYVFTVGFPAPDLLGGDAKFTDGSISALSGPSRDDIYLQVTVSIQPGNSGGPVMNGRGEVVGVVTSTANVKTFLGATGTLPQNVNWAIKGSYGTPLFETPPRLALANTKSDAIGRALAATCLVSVEVGK